MKYALPVAAIAALLPCAAQAAPGLGSEVYGATVDKGELELEAIWGQLDGGPENGEDVLVLEGSYGVTDKLRLGVRGEIEQEVGEDREFEALGIEAIYELGQAGGIDFALYGEYEVVFEGTDKIETKLLMQRKEGPIDLRLNLIAEKELESGEHVEFEYAASAMYEAMHDFELGVQGYGDLGSTDDFLPHAEHFMGPVAKFETEALGPELGLEFGYLFALGEAQEETDGQFRVKLELEF